MVCPKCNSKTRINQTRFNDVDNETYRRRVCLNSKCGYRFYSIEFFAEQNESFREQLRNSIKGGRRINE